MTIREIVYYLLDSCKIISDDSILNEEHILFLVKKYRSFLLRKELEKDKGAAETPSEFDYQQVCLDLEKVPAMDGSPCSGGYYLRSTQKIPKILEGVRPKVYPSDFYQDIHISFVPRERMRYVGTNKWLRNIIWVSLGADLHLYLRSDNPQFLYLKKLRMLAVFEDFDEASDLLCDNEGEDTSCDVLDATFPIRDYLVPSLIELCEKELLGASYRPKDNVNSASDDLSDLASFLRMNMKSGLQKQMEG